MGRQNVTSENNPSGPLASFAWYSVRRTVKFNFKKKKKKKKSFMQQLTGCQMGHSGTRWVMDENEVSIPLHAHNHANLQETDKLHLENRTTFNIWNIDFQRVKGGFNFSEIFQNFSNITFCM